MSLGEISWELDLGSPIVGMYEWKPDGLQKIPFTVVAENTIDSVIRSAVSGENNSRFVGKGKELVLKYAHSLNNLVSNFLFQLNIL